MGAEVDEDCIDVTDSDPHPLSTLHMYNFENISRTLAKSWYMNKTEQTDVVFAKGQCDDAGEVQV
jgi:hypothetical protein